jgi:formamidopyrimidine-DNA glycosylase
MPELPEVETIRRQLAERVEGRTIRGVSITDARLVDPWNPDDFAAHLNGRSIERIDRVGKYLLIELDGGEALTLPEFIVLADSLHRALAR